MNKNLDLTKVLKDCPKGTKFYSTIYGDVYFDYIESSTSSPYSIILKCSDGERIAVTNKGKHYFYYNGECTLFPDKNQRDWSKWHRPFIDGDIVTYKLKGWLVAFIYKERISTTIVKSHFTLYTQNTGFDIDNDIVLKEEYIVFAPEEEKQKLFDAIKTNGYTWNVETKTLEKLIIPKFKVGDIIQDVNKYMVKITEVNVEDEYFGYESIIAKGIGGIAFSEQNYWKLIPNKFDINTLKPFDKVLVRTHPNNNWFATFFSHINYPTTFSYKFVTTSGLSYKYMIPYNEETEYLLGTNNEAPEYYKCWGNHQ